MPNRVLAGLDLASRFSAAHIREEHDGFHEYQEFDSRDKSAIRFCGEFAEETAYRNRAKETWVIVEDLPYSLNSQFQTKAPLRLQGCLMNELSAFGLLDKTVFVIPSTWQRMFPGVARAPKGLKGKAAEDSRIEAARVAALALGYEAPDLIGDYIKSLPEETKILKKNTNPLAKSQTDYRDAFLITQWASTFDSFEAMLEVPGVQRAMI